MQVIPGNYSTVSKPEMASQIRRWGEREKNGVIIGESERERGRAVCVYCSACFFRYVSVYVCVCMGADGHILS